MWVQSNAREKEDFSKEIYKQAYKLTSTNLLNAIKPIKEVNHSMDEQKKLCPLLISVEKWEQLAEIFGEDHRGL